MKLILCKKENCKKKITRNSKSGYCLSCERKNRFKDKTKHPRFGKKISWSNDKLKFNISKEFLNEEYIINRKSLFKISKIIGSSTDTIRRILIKYNITRRKTGEGKKGIKIGSYNSYYHSHLKGKNNPFYGKKHTIITREKMSLNHRKYQSPETRVKISLGHGGTGIPYQNNKYPEAFFRIRNKILEKYNYTCQLCFKYSNEVHHIDYDKNNNEISNLITLCRTCNLKVNKNRNYWKEYFPKLINA